MPTETKTKRGGKRAGAGRKPCSEKGDDGRTHIACVRVEPDIAAWLRMNGGSKKHYELLRRAYIEACIV